MSIKGIVEAAKELMDEISTFVSDMFSALKKFFWWLYNREWTVGELVVIVVAFVIAFAICCVEKKLKEVVKKKGKQDKSQKDKQDKKPSILSEISKTEEDIHSKKSLENGAGNC